ncbi:MAG: tRNA pseudouridine(38-40) synthase TruA, partial [Chitinophagaceae bacterium]
MSRYFIEIAYQGKNYSGLQVQQNAHSVQQAVEKALSILFQIRISTVGSSRTDAGVHAYQNFLHFDLESDIPPHFLYQINSILPGEVVVQGIYRVPPDGHARFHALSRSYEYNIYHQKNPFLKDSGYFYPYHLNMDLLQQAATFILSKSDFTSFSKRNAQVKTFQCQILHSFWQQEGEVLKFQIRANRFLRGMVRGLVGTQLKVGRGKISLEEFRDIFEKKDCTCADFSVPPQGLFLKSVS